MSGFEVAGIVLGSIPLLISGLEHYRDGVETIDNMVQYVEVVNTIFVSVSTNMAIYRQSFESLVQHLMLPENILDELWNKPDSPAWKDQDLAERLKDQFGSPAEYTTYILAVTRLHKRIDKLRSKLELDETFQPAWVSSSAAGPKSLDRFFSKSQKFRRAVKIGFNNDKYLQLVDAIEADVNRIKTLAEGARTLDPIRAERHAKEAAKYWLSTRDCARGLFATLNSCWPQTCRCQITHVASIRLEILNISRPPTSGKPRQRFKLLFTFATDSTSGCTLPWKWRVVEVEPVLACTTSNPPPVVQQPQSSYSPVSGSTPSMPIPTIIRTHVDPSLPQTINANPTWTQTGPSSISNLCDALLRATHQGPSLGFLQDQEWHHHFYAVRPWQDLDNRNQLASLDKVLTSSGSMGTKTKFRLAAALASAVLQFHATPWLDDKWDLREIYFLGDTTNTTTTTNTSSHSGDQHQPYIAKRFARAQQQQQQLPTTQNHKPRRQRDPSVSNEILFALGTALLELSYGKPLLSYQQPDDLDERGEANALTKPLIAKRLLHDLGDREPSKYVDVIDRCIRCRFDTTSTSLEDPMFLALFCQGVVIPLREICDSVA